jgi:hypothetical protein
MRPSVRLGKASGKKLHGGEPATYRNRVFPISACLETKSATADFVAGPAFRARAPRRVIFPCARSRLPAFQFANRSRRPPADRIECKSGPSGPLFCAVHEAVQGQFPTVGKPAQCVRFRARGRHVRISLSVGIVLETPLRGPQPNPTCPPSTFPPPSLVSTRPARTGGASGRFA